jgi:hypothetical protein
MIAARRERDPGYKPPALIDVPAWAFPDSPTRRILGRLAARLFRTR